MTALSFSAVTKQFENGYTAFAELSFEIVAGTFVSIVGPSGCGKSTVLNVAAGLATATTGFVSKSTDAATAYMFQQDALLPWKTVRENAALGLELRGSSPKRAIELLRHAGLDAFADAYPAQLSGGMRKRVAMVQCLAIDPQLLFMDEPFGALDVHTRHRMEGQLLDLWSAARNTVLFVTHDLEEAISLSDRILVLSAGPSSKLIGDYTIDLPRPRPLLDIKTDTRFIEIYRSIWHDLRSEVIRSYES